MVRNKILVSRLGVVSLSFLIAFAVYCFARSYPPEIFTPFIATNNYLSSYTSIFGSAPSFFYTLALGLAIGVCASSQSSSRFHCLIWIGLALILEVSQHSIIAESVAGWTKTNFPNSIWTLIGPYWARGVFDFLDLLATLLGGGIAMYLLNHLPLEKDNVRDL